MNRICELLAKALLLEKAHRVVDDRTASASAAPGPVKDESDDARLEALVALRGEVSPTSIREMLGWPRTRVYLAGHRLQVAGRIVAVGQTRSLVYRISPDRGARAVLN